jgi:hypothetical protein
MTRGIFPLAASVSFCGQQRFRTRKGGACRDLRHDGGAAEGREGRGIQSAVEKAARGRTTWQYRTGQFTGCQGGDYFPLKHSLPR